MAFTCSRKDGSSHGTEYSTLRVITCVSVRAAGEYDVRDLRVWIEGRRSPALRLEPLVSLGGGDSRRCRIPSRAHRSSRSSSSSSTSTCSSSEKLSGLSHELQHSYGFAPLAASTETFSSLRRRMVI